MAQEETRAADGAPAPWDPEQWWSFGEAADRAGVTHRTLQDWAERGEVMVRMAWREGTEFRLVRAGDVARLAPHAAGPADRSAPLEERALFTGPRRSALGAGAPVAPRDSGGATPAMYEDDRDAFRRTAETEIERLRGELDLLRRRGAPAAPAASPAPMDLWSIEEPRRAPLLGGKDRWRAGRLPVFACGLVLGALAAGWVGSPDGRAPGEGEAGASVQGPSGSAAAAVAKTAPVGRSSAPPDHRLTADLAQVNSIGAEPTVVTEAPAGAAGESSTSTEDAEVLVAAPTRLPLGLESIDALPHASLDGRSVCDYGAGQLADPSTRFILGGCWGALSSDGATVLATDRVAGVACCKHHAAVQRLKGIASSPRALAVAQEEAAQAIRDGLVPPMLELRAERSAAPLASTLTGGWRASGFDGPAPGRSHRWELSPSDDAPVDGVGARLELRSWVERGEDGALATYRMVLELGESAAGDRAVEFQWLE